MLTKYANWPAQKWRWIMPILLLSLFLATLIWLPWQAQRMEANERQEQLIADTLWVEQTIMFQLNRNDEVVRQIGADIVNLGISPEQVLERFRQILSNNREVSRLSWLDPNEQILVTTEKGAEGLMRRPKPAIITSSLFEIDRKTRCFQPALDTEQQMNSYLISCQIPLYRQNRHYGSVVISYFANGLLDELIPWWFAQENQVSIVDNDETVYATRTAGGIGKNIYSHNRALELPGLSLILRTNSIKAEPKILSNMLVVTVILLSVGLIWSLLALWRDINRRLAAEGALRQQLIFRSAMENSLVTGLRARDMQGRLTYVNPAFCKMIGIPAEELIGRIPPLPYWAPEAYEEYEERYRQLLSGTVPAEGFETVYQHADGTRIPVLIYESPLIDETGQQAGWMSSILDISELRHAQELTRQQEEKLHVSAKLATMGELASMLAHELNQPLAAISSYTTATSNMLEAGEDDRSLLRSALEKINAQAQRAGQIIRSVYDVVKKREPARQLISVQQVIQNAMPLIELQAQALRIPVHYDIASDLPSIMADPVLLEQVLLNLSRNAVEAMHGTTPARRLLQIQADFQLDSHEVIIQIRDRGHGISEEVAARLFSPFFTTKSAGMGMGLNICRTAIEFHGGRLTHGANPDGGTVFRISLPVPQES